MRTATTFALFACAIPLLAQQVPIALHDDSLSRDTDEIRVRFECLFPSHLKMISVLADYAAPSIDGAPQLSPALSLELELGARAARRVRPTAGVYRLEGASISVAALAPELEFHDQSRIAVECCHSGIRLASGHRFSRSRRVLPTPCRRMDVVLRTT